MLNKDEWQALTRLYIAGRQGIKHTGSGYGAAGSWDTLKALRDHDPVLAREVTRLDPANATTHYLMVITDAGTQFYEKKRRLYTALYG
ncbi:MAG: hypothetical protein JXA10_00240 [Anaerolineae bacterium]|nr:hypothetical protein [Anaerolineae bacterium]